MMGALWAMLLLSLTGLARGGELLPFDAESMARIRQEMAGQPFLLAFWSVHCEPCRDEMPQWRVLRQRFPGVHVLLVAADEPGEHGRVLDFLAAHDLTGVRTYAYDDAFAERIRHSVDPRWRGELPRAYFFDAAHRVSARSGRLGPAQLEKWMGGR